MDPESLNAFAAVGGEDFVTPLVGLSRSVETNQLDAYEAYVNQYPEFGDVPFIGDLYDGTFSVESVINLNPDVLIMPLYALSYDYQPDMSPLDAAGIPYVYIDFVMNVYIGDSYNRSASLLGTLLGEEERAADIIDFYNQQLNTVSDVINTLDESYPRPFVYIEYPDAGATNYGLTTVNYDMALPIIPARGYNVAEGAIIEYGTINGEYLIDANPEVIMFCSGTGIPEFSDGIIGFGANPSTEELHVLVSAFLERDGWDTIDAVKNGKVYFWHGGLMVSIENFAIVQYMAKWFYPELFTALDPLQNLQDFYTQFMPIPLEGTWTFSSGEVLG
jgi:iron complex transport system substrate-binding protein